jgi:hypothetical protein
MHKHSLVMTAVACTFALAAPAASAQAQTFNGTYTDKFVGPHGSPQCPDDAFACGTGTAAGFGTFTDERVFDPASGTVLRTLTFSDGSTLTLDEDLVSFTGPGGSGSSHAGPNSEGHPGHYVFSWTITAGTGSFAGATGSGTDDSLGAGLVASGSLSGLVTTQ